MSASACSEPHRVKHCRNYASASITGGQNFQHTAPRFSVPNFGMRTNAPNTRLGRRCFRESHPGDTTFFPPPFFFFPFFFSLQKAREEESLCGTVRNIKRTTRDHRSFPFNQHRERDWYIEGKGREMRSFYGSEVFVFCRATWSKSEILHRGEIKKEGKARWKICDCGGNGVSQPPCRVQWAKGSDGEHVFVNDSWGENNRDNLGVWLIVCNCLCGE